MNVVDLANAGYETENEVLDEIENGGLKDPAQEFAERVAAKCFGPYDEYHFGGGEEELAELIASELRAGGWVDKASHEKALAEQWEDAADFTIGRKRLDEIREDPTKVIKWADLEASTASVGTNVEIKP